MARTAAAPRPPVPTVPIPALRSRSGPSPYVDTKVAVSGVLTGVERGPRSGKVVGIFLQDPKGDRSKATSDAVYVRVGELSPQVEGTLQLWSPVSVTGTVKAEGEGTILQAAKGALLVSGPPLADKDRPAPVTLKLPRTDARRESYFKSLDGMLVSLPRAMVIDPTAHGEFIAVDPAQTGPGAIPKGKDPLPSIAVTDRLGFSAQVNTGTMIEGVFGPIKYDDGAVKHWHIMQGGRFTKVDAAGPPPAMWGDLDGDGAISPNDLAAIERRVGTQVTGPRDAADLDYNGVVSKADVQLAAQRAERAATPGPKFRIASYNMGNLFDSTDNPHNKLETVLTPEQYGTKLARVAGSIRTSLGAPAIIAMQEVENERVLRDLVERPELADLRYRFVLMPGEDPRGINNALLYRSDQVTMGEVRQHQPPAPDPAAKGRDGLFSRPPLVADIRVAAPDGSAQELTIVANHFKSHYSPTGAPTEPQRLAEAKAVRALVKDLRSADPERPVVVLGDLNDGIGSKPVKQLTGTPSRPFLRDVTAELIPPGERYSFVFRGERNLLDHILATDDLAQRAVFAGARHINVDLAEASSWGSLPYGASDHDPVVVDFAFPTAPADDALAGAAATTGGRGK